MNAIQEHYFDVLGIKPTANIHSNKEAYMRKVTQLHADKTWKTASTQAMRGVQEAWEALRDGCPAPDDNRSYDLSVEVARVKPVYLSRVAVFLLSVLLFILLVLCFLLFCLYSSFIMRRAGRGSR